MVFWYAIEKRFESFNVLILRTCGQKLYLVVAITITGSLQVTFITERIMNI